jgi:hypothetical protein
LPRIDRLNAVLLLGILTLTLILHFSVTGMISVANAAPNSGAKPMAFYWHYVDAPVSVAGTQTHYILNTTRWFKFQTNSEAFENAFFKPVGLPKIVVDFHLYPNLAGPVTANGTWQIFVWVNSSAYHPSGFNIEFWEIDIGGTELWTSGNLNPIVTSSVGSYIDVPVHCYNLSYANLAHTFNVDTTILAKVTINPGSSADCRVWYDSPMYPSKVIFPFEDYAKPISVKTYDVNYAETNLFQHNWTESRRKIVVHANVTDPFGGYDIYNVNLTILDRTGQPVLDNIDMTRISDGFWLVHYLHTYEAIWAYPGTPVLGNYTVEVSVIDNNGYYHFVDYGTFDPYIEYASHIFNIGIVILYNPSFEVVDDVDNSLPRAQVYIRFPNGTTNTLPLYTDNNGIISLQHVPPGNYAFTILWKDVIVQQTTQYVDSDGPYIIKCHVYQLTANVLGSNGIPVHGAYVVVYTHAGIVYDFQMTDSAGHAVFQLPSSDIQIIGSYTIEVYYSTTYWLTPVTATATEPSISVTSSGPATITLTDFPPAMWATTGFWLIFAFMVAVVAGAVGFLYKKGVIFKRRA